MKMTTKIEMKMNSEIYEDLVLRFSKELHEVGVTDNMKKIIEAQYSRAPNTSSCGTDENVRRFCYRHDGYEIEAVQNVKVTIKKCTQGLDLGKKEMVDHPSHYNQGKIEVIDAIEDWELNFCEGNVIKYVARHRHKSEPLEDLKKAQWYLDRLIQGIESEGR